MWKARANNKSHLKEQNLKKEINDLSQISRSSFDRISSYLLPKKSFVECVIKQTPSPIKTNLHYQASRLSKKRI